MKAREELEAAHATDRAEIEADMQAIVDWLRERPDLPRDSVEFLFRVRAYNARKAMLRHLDWLTGDDPPVSPTTTPE